MEILLKIFNMRNISRTTTPLLLVLVSLLLQPETATASSIRTNELNQEVYGRDVSWATHSKELKWGDKQELYNDFMEECRVAAGSASASYCDAGEDFRIKMNTHQPSSMRNYTRLGFEKIKAPKEMFDLIKNFWIANKDKNESEWGHSVNTYHNMWSSPPSIVNIQEERQGGGLDLTTKVWEAARLTLEEWTGMHLSPCSIWGIRIYHNNSILTTHVDRNPLVTSAIINVAQDVDEEWPLEVWGHDGMPYNITMEPGDMVLYESHSVLHGRPFPMRGNHYANIFVHFEPLGYHRREDGHDNYFSQEEMHLHKETLESKEQGLPPYVLPNSPWSKQWRESNSDGWELLKNNAVMGVRDGNLQIIDNLYLKNGPEVIHKADSNGWNPLHEAARAGHVHVARYLYEKGIDLNAKTNAGQTALHLTNSYHSTNSDMYNYLKSIGAQ